IEKEGFMLLFKDLPVERKREIINYIKKNENESSDVIAKRFNISKSKVEILKRKHLNKHAFRPF
ncbi:hypothetical protein, partial [Billgrantia desiderata]|uniref:hypothetical protein n=1 Tax=Billgrantia desiderata TaxID=52021 RepID=UPI003F3F02C8